MNAIGFIAEHLQANPPSDKTPLCGLISEDMAAIDLQANALHARLDAFGV